MSYKPLENNTIPEAPLQLCKIICEDYKRMTICARFAPNIKRKITAYKAVYRA